MTRAFRTRLAANTLVWIHEGITIRLESDLSRGEALELAARFVAAS